MSALIVTEPTAEVAAGALARPLLSETINTSGVPPVADALVGLTVDTTPGTNTLPNADVIPTLVTG